jgi:hypothetical protein
MLNQKPVDMKRSSIIFFVMALFLVSCEEEAKKAVQEKQEAKKKEEQTVAEGEEKTEDEGTTVVFGAKAKPKRNDEGEFDCLGNKGFCLIIGADLAGKDPEPGHNEAIGDLFVRSEHLYLGIKKDNDPDNKGDRFVVPEDYELNQRIVEELGYRSVTMEEGSYEVDYSKEDYPFGWVELEAELE